MKKVKHQVKKIIRDFLLTRNILLTFPGELNKSGFQRFLVTFYMKQSRGILHIGAHTGGEREFYDRIGKKVLWIEANPNIYTILLANIQRYPNQKAINELVGARDEMTNFFLTSNGEQSSSVLPLTPKGAEFWRISETDTLRLQAKKIDSLAKNHELDNYDFWVLDVQGLEASVIEGSKKALVNVNALLVECSTEQYYDGVMLYPELRELLYSHGFTPAWVPTNSHFDMLFVRN